MVLLVSPLCEETSRRMKAAGSDYTLLTLVPVRPSLPCQRGLASRRGPALQGLYNHLGGHALARRDNLTAFDFFGARLSGVCRFHFRLPFEASPVWQKTGPRPNCTDGRADARGVGAINTGDKFHAGGAGHPACLDGEAGKGVPPNQRRRQSLRIGLRSHRLIHGLQSPQPTSCRVPNHIIIHS